MEKKYFVSNCFFWFNVSNFSTDYEKNKLKKFGVCNL